MKRILLLVSLAWATPALADEGMWTYEQFPSAQVKQQYGFEPTQAWLDHARLASAQIDDDSSGSFVSPEGLVLTNHHCVRMCIERLSSAKHDFITQGFLAKARADELTCPGMELDQLVEMTDVTEPLQKASELETLRLTFALTKLREVLGPDHPVVRKVLGQESPRALATRAVRGTKLFDVKFRRALLTGGRAALEASSDPMLRLAALLDPDARAAHHVYEDELGAIVRKNSERIAHARFAVYGTRLYPDATDTLRLSYGIVKGYEQEGQQVPAFTTFGRAFARDTGEEPFALPESWHRARKALRMEQPLNFVTTNDIIGGNSGSPMLNQNAELTGVVFDSNIHSLGGEYGFDARRNRTIGVDSTALLEALDKVYGASRLLEELRPVRGPGRSKE